VAVLVIPNIVMDVVQLRRRGGFLGTARRFTPLLAWTMLGVVVGTKLLEALSARAVTLALGAFVVGYVALTAFRIAPRVPPGSERWVAVPVGLAAGMLGGITSSLGPPLAVYFMALGLAKHEFVLAIALTFLIAKVVQLASLVWVGLLGWSLVLGALGLTAAGLVGFGLGLRVQDRMPQQAFNRAVLVFLGGLGAWLVLRAW
jgi:hypothetical protein